MNGGGLIIPAQKQNSTIHTPLKTNMTYEKSPCSLRNIYIDKNSWWEFPPPVMLEELLRPQYPNFHVSLLPNPTKFLEKPIQNKFLLQFHTIDSFVLFACFLFVPTKKTLIQNNFILSRRVGCIFSSPVSQFRSVGSYLQQIYLEPRGSSRSSRFRHLNRTAFPSWTWSRLQIVSLSCLKIAGGLPSWKSRETNGSWSPKKGLAYFSGGIGIGGSP